MTSRPILILVCLCLVCIGVQAQPVAAEEATPPTRQAFEAQVQALREHVNQLTTELAQAEAEVRQIDADRRALSDQERAIRDEQREADKGFYAGWDRVRQLVVAGAGQAEIEPAARDARKNDADYHAARKEREARLAELRARSTANRERLQELNEQNRVASTNLRRLQDELRERESVAFGREDWYAQYLSAKAQREQRDREREERRAKLEEERAFRDKALADARERWVAMSPEQREQEAQRLEAWVKSLDEKRQELQTQRELHREYSATTAAKRTALREESRALYEQVRLAWAKFHERRAAGAEQAELDELAQAARAAEAEHNPKREALKEQLDEVDLQLNELNKIYGQLLDEISKAGTAWHEAKQFTASITAPVREQAENADNNADPEQREKQRREKRDTQRDSWQLATGKEVQWQDNPFAGTPVRLGGGIANGQARFQVLADTEDYHAVFIVEGKSRGLLVFDAQGSVLFKGPVNNAAERAALSLDLYYLWEFVDRQVQIEGF